MRKTNFPLRLQPSLMEEARKVAESEGVALNQLINVALAEKVSVLRTEEYFRARIHRADRSETLRILDRARKGNPPRRATNFRENGRAEEERENGPKKQLRKVASSRNDREKQDAAELHVQN
jgi:hypothetical protein